MINFVDLDLNIYPLRDPRFARVLKSSHQKINISFINPHLIKYLKKFNIEIFHAVSFYSPPYYTQPIHRDGLFTDLVKMNFVIGGTNSVMNWYTIKDNADPEPKKTRIGATYKEYELDQVEIIDTHTIKFPTLVQVGIPHNIINDYESRLCICLVLLNKSMNLLTMKEALDAFKSVI